jgi:fission 1 protein
MGETKTTGRKAKAHVDEKLAMSVPSHQLLEELAAECASNPSLDNTFQYAFALCKSDSQSELKYAVTILDGLIKEYRHQVDCMYGAATALYLLGKYDEARSRCEAILRSKPDMRDVAELHAACIIAMEDEQEAKMKEAAVKGTIGVAAVGLAIGIAGMLLSKRR